MAKQTKTSSLTTYLTGLVAVIAVSSLTVGAYLPAALATLTAVVLIVATVLLESEGK